MSLKTLVLLSVLVMQTSFAGDTQPIPLTEEQKQQVIDELQAYDLNKGLKLKNDAIAAGEQPLDLSPCDDQGDFKEHCIKYTTEHTEAQNLHSRQLATGKYLSGICFINDSQYKDKPAPENLDELLIHFLQDTYILNAPKVAVVNESKVCIDIFLSPFEMDQIIADERIFYIYTAAAERETSTLND